MTTKPYEVLHITSDLKPNLTHHAASTKKTNMSSKETFGNNMPYKKESESEIYYDNVFKQATTEIRNFTNQASKKFQPNNFSQGK